MASDTFNKTYSLNIDVTLYYNNLNWNIVANDILKSSLNNTRCESNIGKKILVIIQSNKCSSLFVPLLDKYDNDYVAMLEYIENKYMYDCKREIRRCISIIQTIYVYILYVKSGKITFDDAINKLTCSLDRFYFGRGSEISIKLSRFNRLCVIAYECTINPLIWSQDVNIEDKEILTVHNYVYPKYRQLISGAKERINNKFKYGYGKYDAYILIDRLIQTPTWMTISERFEYVLTNILYHFIGNYYGWLKIVATIAEGKSNG